MKLKNIIIAIITLIAIGSQLKAQQKLEDLSSAKEFAMADLQNVLSLMPVGDESDYGFNNRDEFKKASIGDFVVLENIAHDGNVEFTRFRFSVSVNGEPRALVSYRKENGAFIMCGFGADELAGEVDRIQSQKKSRSSVINLVRVNDEKFKGDFLNFNGASKGLPSEGYTPMSSSYDGIYRLGRSTKSTFSLKEILSLGVE